MKSTYCHCSAFKGECSYKNAFNGLLILGDFS